MLGQIVWVEGRKATKKLELMEIEGMRVLRGECLRRGLFWRWRLGRLLGRIRGQGIRRLLVPADFVEWKLAEKKGLFPVTPLKFLRRNSGKILILAMKKRGYLPEECKIALRGTRVGQDMILTADDLVHLVRDVAISAPQGGESLQNMLRQEWGLGVASDGEDVVGAIRFDQGGSQVGAVVLSLFGARPTLGGLAPNTEYFPPFLETDPLPLLATLWESGKIGEDAIEFYLT